MNGFFTFTNNFRYLGSYISYNLRYYFVVEARIIFATKAMVDIKIFWYNKHVDVYSKYLIFQAILMNLLLWGGEAWLLPATLKNKIELFLQHHSIWIFKISMFQVKYNHIH